MKESTRLSIIKALAKLRDAENIDADVAPGAVVHSAYYAMLHAAHALILEKTELQVHKHGSIIGEFGRLLKERDESVKEHGRAINRGQALRDADDYDVTRDADSEEAKALREEARSLFEFVVSELGTTRRDLAAHSE